MRLRNPLLSAGLVSLAALLAVPFALAGDEEIKKPARDGSTRAPALRPGEDPPEVVAKEIDLFIDAVWKEEGFTPRERCSDEEYVRRVYLDVVGTVPSAEQVRIFLADKADAKRVNLVEALLDSPGYARHFTNRWGKVLVGQGTNKNNREYQATMFRLWLEKRFRDDASYGEMVTEMLTATGTVYDSPALNYQGRRDHTPADLAGSMSKAFLGVQIQCAQCHDHPYEEITQRDFQSIAAFWARQTLRPEVIPYERFGAAAARRAEKRYEDQVKNSIEKQGMTEEQARMYAERRRPKSMKVGEIPGGSRFPKALQRRYASRIGDAAKVTPKFLLGDEYVDTKGETRRQALSRWIVDPANPYTSRALANRYWGWFLGRGFVHPVDDFSSVNIPTIPTALDRLAEDTAAHDFDLKRLVRVITATRAYQLSTKGGERTVDEAAFFAAGPLKPLTPQQTFDSLQISLGVAEDGTAMSSIEGYAPSSLDMGGGRAMMPGGAMDDGSRSRTSRLLRGAATQYFQTFDDDEGNEAESFEGTVPQGLFLLNSQAINGLLTERGISIVPGVVKDFDSESDRIRHLFLRTLSRQPTSKELRRFVKFVKNQPKRETVQDKERERRGKKPRKRFVVKEDRVAAAYADILWTLVSTSEYATNH